MAMKLVYEYTGTITADAIVELPPLDLSRADQLYMEAYLTGNAADAVGDTLNIYLQNRWQAGVWSDRVALSQLTGDMLAGELRDAALSKFGSLSDTEEAAEPSGSTGGSHLTAGTVRNGPFPPRFRAAGVNAQATAWRVNFDATVVGSASWPIAIYIYADSVD